MLEIYLILFFVDKFWAQKNYHTNVEINLTNRLKLSVSHFLDLRKWYFKNVGNLEIGLNRISDSKIYKIFYRSY